MLVQLDVDVHVDVDEGVDVGAGDDDVIVVGEENLQDMTPGAPPIAVSSEPSSAAGEHNDQCTGRNPAGQQRFRLVSSTLEGKGIPSRNPK